MDPVTQSHSERKRRTIFHRNLAFSTSLLAVSILLAGCVGGSDDHSSEGNGNTEKSEKSPDVPEKDKPIASSRITNFAQPIRFDITAFERTSDEVVTLRFSATNEGKQNYDPIDFFGSAFALPGRTDQKAPNGITFIDAEHKKRYYPLSSVDDECYCTSWENMGYDYFETGEKINGWVAFPAPPKDIKSFTIIAPGVSPFTGIKATNGESAKGEKAPGELKEPKILDISGYAEELDGSATESQTDGERSIMLSSDVLFDTDESVLTGEAKKSIANVADEIDESGANKVKIDGYTDNSGDDSINNPLSDARASAVEEELDKLISRSGISFETAGHGSADPIATNKTKSGKSKNRRVTITFAK